MRLSKELTPEEIADMKQAILDFAETTTSFVKSNWKALHNFLDKQAEIDSSDDETASEEPESETTAIAGFMCAEMRPNFERLVSCKST